MSCKCCNLAAGFGIDITGAGSNASPKVISAEAVAARNDLTSGSKTINSVAWTDLDNTLDIVLVAAVGDWVEVGMSHLWSTEATYGFLDVVSVVGGAPVNTWGLDGPETATSQGVQAWTGIAAFDTRPGGVIGRFLVAGDISAGTVTLRVRTRTLDAVNKTLVAIPDAPVVYWAANRG